MRSAWNEGTESCQKWVYFSPAGARGERSLDQASQSEEAGFESLLLSDHFHPNPGIRAGPTVPIGSAVGFDPPLPCSSTIEG